MQSIITELNLKISELTELVNNERSNQLEEVKHRHQEMHEQNNRLKMEIRAQEQVVIMMKL